MKLEYKIIKVKNKYECHPLDFETGEMLKEWISMDDLYKNIKDWVKIDMVNTISLDNE